MYRAAFAVFASWRETFRDFPHHFHWKTYLDTPRVQTVL